MAKEAELRLDYAILALLMRYYQFKPVCEYGLSAYPAGVMWVQLTLRLLKLILSTFKLTANNMICDCGVAGRTKASASAREEGLERSSEVCIRQAHCTVGNCEVRERTLSECFW